MSEWTAGMTNPFVVSGPVTTLDRSYKVKASQSFKTGELIRLTTAGTVQVAALDTDTVGAVHGIALANAADHDTGGINAGKPIPVAMFHPDTVIGIQLMAEKDQNDVKVGASYRLAVASNKWTLTVTADKGIAQVAEKSSEAQWFDPRAAADLDRSIVFVRFPASVLDGRDAEA
jgi:hypothetical protein